MRLSLLLLSAPVVLSAQEATRVRELDAYTTRAVRDWRVPGLAIAVIKNGRVVLAKGYGTLELGRPATVDANTLFEIGSTTKAMTTMALAMLVDDGKVRWDDPVTKYLPALQLADPYVTRELMVKDLITHRAGLPNADFLWQVGDIKGEEITRRARYVKPVYSLRSGFIYQNIMYAVAGQVVAAANGTSWEAFIRTRILQPLGMTRTVFNLDEATRAMNVASPHAIWNDTVRVITNRSFDPVLTPAGANVWSSVNDMAKWLRFMLDSGRYEGKSLVKVDTYREIVRPQTMTPHDFFPTYTFTHPHWTSYALGWFQQDYNGRKIDFHTGSIDGMAAIAGMMLDEGLGVFVLSNLDGAPARHALMLKTFDLFTNAPVQDWSKDLSAFFKNEEAKELADQKRLDQQRVTGTRPSLALEKYVGVYTDSLYGTRRVVLASGGLRIGEGTDFAGKLEHWQYDTFRANYDHRWFGWEPVDFAIGPDGLPSTLTVGTASFHRVTKGESR